MTRRAVAAVGAAAALAVAVAALALVVVHRLGRSGPIRLTVTAAPVTRPRPADFLGLSIENRTIPEWVGRARTPARVDPVLLGLIRTLNPSGRPMIRIGGQSTDRSWWPGRHLHRPAGVTYALNRHWAQDARSLAGALRARLVIGINLEADSRRLARHEARRLLHVIGRRWLTAFVIGNEPSLYTTTAWYRVRDGRRIPWNHRHVGVRVFARAPGYDVADFLTEFQRTLAVLPRRVAIAGPDALSTTWLRPFSTLVPGDRRIRILDSHAYALQDCVHDPASPAYPSIAHLLSVRAWHNVLRGALPFVALAHRHGLAFRIDELGSVTCNGRRGVSDTMASALWVTDALFYAAREGVDGVNLHSYPHSANGLFDLSHRGRRWRAAIHPIYAGTAMFARADPPSSRQLTLTGPHPPLLQTWATLSADRRTVRVLIDNGGDAHRVVIRPPAGFASQDGSLQRLLAPSVTSTHGLTLGGRTIGTTTTGRLPAPTPVSVAPRAGGYALMAPADSETLLTLSSRQ